MMKRIILIAVVAIFFGLAAFITIRVLQFRLVKTTPRNNATSVVPPSEITFVFSQKVNSDKLPAIQISPPLAGKLSANGKTLTYTVSEPAQYAQHYTVTLQNILSRLGKNIPTAEVSFSTASQSPNEAQQQKALRELLPKTTDQYSIDYIDSDGSYSVTIQSAPIQSSKKAALDFLSKYSVTPEKNKITFYVIPGIEGSTSVGP